MPYIGCGWVVGDDRETTNRKMCPIQMANRQLVGLKFRCDSTSSLQEGSDICQSTQYYLRSWRDVRPRLQVPASPHIARITQGRNATGGVYEIKGQNSQPARFKYTG